MVSTVMGTPVRRKSPKRMGTPRELDRSATMRFAMEPRMVRFPANVALIAITSQISFGLGRWGTTGRQSITAGTFDTRFDRTVIAALTVTASCYGLPRRPPAAREVR